MSLLDGDSLWLKIAEPPAAPVETVISWVKGGKKKERERIGRRKSYRLDCLILVM